MNLLLAVALMAVARVTLILNLFDVTNLLLNTAELSLLLCFFNLIPIPPLDGSHVMRHAVGMSYETYWKLCRFGFIAIIIVINLPGVWDVLNFFIGGTSSILMFCFHFPS